MLPLFVRVTATAAGYFRLSQDGAPAAVGDLLVQPSDGLILKTCGLSQFSFVSQSGASTVTVTPIDVGGIKYPANIFTPLTLFTTGVNGAWYDPSDFSTMFQDAAGTTPVTAVGQPVGRILDKSGRGNHAFNASGNSANFPVLSARYNLLMKTEQFNDAAWVKIGSSTASNANTLNFPNTNEPIAQAATMTATAGTTATFSVELSGSGTIYIGCYRSEGGTYEEDRLKVTLTSTPTRYYISHTMVNAGQAGFGGYISRATDGTATTVTASKAQLIHANDALNQPAYQRVNTATDYDTAGFKPYLSFNGVNQWLQTNSLDFTYGDKMFVSAGVRKLSDGARAMIFELGTIGTNLFRIEAPSSLLNDLNYVQGGSVVVGASSPALAPTTNVLSGIGNISGDQSILRVNGTQAAISTADQGTGNFGNYPMYIGARAGASLWFNGRLYGLVVAGKAASASEVASTEAWLNSKTGAY